MWNIPAEKQLQNIPRLNETQAVRLQDKIIHMHFFLGSCHWYAAEYDGEDLFFGFVILHGDHFGSEWGYFSFSELKNVKIDGFIEVDNDLYWQVKKASEVPGIKLHNYP